jgi:3-hydroxybutyrate dehydrogenase
MKFDFTGKNVLVTGHSRGIGKAIYDMFKENGATVFGASTVQCNFANIAETLDYAEGRLVNFNIDILINCAGINEKGSIENYTPEGLQRIMNVNFFSPMILCQAVIQNMKKKGWGRIVNIGSIYADRARDNRLGYVSSKHALLGLTRSLAIDLKEYGITVNMISPNVTNTDMTHTMLAEKEFKAAALCSPNMVAHTVLVACDTINNEITGLNVLVDSVSSAIKQSS